MQPRGVPNPHVAAAPAHKEPKPEHCPGHGPLDAPHHVNWWHGMLMVNNERAEQGGVLNTLLFRYHNEENPCDAKNEPPPFLASLLNFGLLAFVMYRFGRKPVAEGLAKRKQSIMQEIDNASRLKNEAAIRLREYEEKFERIEETLAELKAELALQAEVEKRHLLAEAEERRLRMKRDAEFRIEQELKAAKAALLQSAVQEAVVAAEELLKKSASAQDQDRMTQEYLSAIPLALSKGGPGAAPSASAGAAGGQS
jgi:F-type H+-transporting ATPase subunit b